MELPNVGQQCAEDDCKQLDFLPLHCKCGKKFCSEHFNLHIKFCETSIRPQTELRKIDKVYKCSHNDCGESSLVPLICNKCRQHFCVKHRHFTQCQDKDEKTIADEKEKYDAPVRQFNEAKIAVDRHIEHSLKEARKKGKYTDLVNKVQLMKIKNKAKGSTNIPITERVYFNITHPKSEQISPVFVSKNWSVGRAIDAIALECKLQNDNDKGTSKKLRLFKKDTGEIISKNMADILQFIISNGVVVDGENLVMEYVNHDCLTNV